MPYIAHGRYRGGNAYVRTSPVAVQLYTDGTHSKFFDASKFDEAQVALTRQNMPAFVRQEAAGIQASQEAARLLGLTVKVLRDMAREAGIRGRSKLNKAGLVQALAGTV